MPSSSSLAKSAKAGSSSTISTLAMGRPGRRRRGDGLPGGGHGDGEARALPQLRGDVDGAAHALHRLLDDEKAQTRAGDAFGALVGHVHLAEAPEEFAQVLGRDALARVLHDVLDLVL